jgi:hypothetical protein
MKTDTLAGLMPLEPPPAPTADPTLWIALALLLALALPALWIAWSRPARRRLRRLLQLERQLAMPGCDTATSAAEAERLLQHFSPPGPLQATLPPPAVQAGHWQALVGDLHAARFGTRPLDGARLAEALSPVRRQLESARGRA